MAACEDPAGFGLLRWAVGDALTSAALATPGLMLAATPCRGWNLRELLEHLSDSLEAVREAITCGRVGLGRAPAPGAPAGTGREPAGCSQPDAGTTLATSAGPELSPIAAPSPSPVTGPHPGLAAPPSPSPAARPHPGLAAPPGPGAGRDTGAECDPVAALHEQAVKLLAACAAAPDGDQVVTIGGAGLPRSTVAEAGAVEVAVHGWDIRMACGDHRPVPSALAVELLSLAVLLVPAGTRHGLFADPVPVPRTSGPGDRLVAFLGRRPPLLLGDGHSPAG